MSILRFPDEETWRTLEGHLTSGIRERFAFAMCTPVRSPGGQLALLVTQVITVPDGDIDVYRDGSSISGPALDRVHNEAVLTGLVPVEFHRHRFGPPAFSLTDEASLGPTATYVTGLHPAQLYGAAVYAEGRVHADLWTRDGETVSREPIRSVAVVGTRLRVLNASPRPLERLARQDPLLGQEGASTLAAIRTVFVGAGGTGSQVLLAAALLGIRDSAVLDSDKVELTNLNRLVTASLEDVGDPKADVARHRMLGIDPDLEVAVGPSVDRAGSELLWDADLIVGCLDNDGPRDVLNQIAITTGTPYIDIATGADDGDGLLIGGRVVLVRPGGPCLHCLGELDPDEIGRWAKPENQAALDRRHGYGTGVPDPAVVHLNGLASNAALAEVVAWIAGHRPPAQVLDIDLTGHLAAPGSPPGSRISPRQPVGRRPGCIACGRG